MGHYSETVSGFANEAARHDREAIEYACEIPTAIDPKRRSVLTAHHAMARELAATNAEMALRHGIDTVDAETRGQLFCDAIRLRLVQAWASRVGDDVARERAAQIASLAILEGPYFTDEIVGVGSTDPIRSLLWSTIEAARLKGYGSVMLTDGDIDQMTDGCIYSVRVLIEWSRGRWM